MKTSNRIRRGIIPLLLAAAVLWTRSVPAAEVQEMTGQEEKPQKKAPEVSARPPLVLFNNGSNPLPIIIAKDAPPYSRRAVAELADFIEKISGTKPEVIEELRRELILEQRILVDRRVASSDPTS